MSDIQAFNFYKDNAALVIAIEPITPLRGSGSLIVQRISAGQYVNGVRATGQRAFTSGRARFLGSRSGAALNDRHSGFAFQQSQEDLTGGAGTAYWVHYDEPGGAGRLQLRRLSAGLGTSTLLASGGSFTAPVAPNAVPIEVTWLLDLANLNGIRLIVKHGAVGDYRTTEPDWDVLTTDIDLVSTTTVLQASVGEGPACSVGGANQKYYWDAFDVIPLTVGG